MGQAFLMGQRGRLEGFYATGLAPVIWFSPVYGVVDYMPGYGNRYANTYTIPGIDFEPKGVQMIALDRRKSTTVVNPISLSVISIDSRMDLATVSHYNGYFDRTEGLSSYAFAPFDFVYFRAAKTLKVRAFDSWSLTGNDGYSNRSAPGFTYFNDFPNRIAWCVTG